MNHEQLASCVAQDAALRRRQRLQPVGGAGDKIFPPTYPSETKGAPPEHVFEARRLPGQGDPVWCVLVDSVQSQANRLEECLREVCADGLAIPHAVVDFSAANLVGLNSITSFDAPHRVYDAILRDSLLNGKGFLSKDNPVGKRLIEANAADASALLEISPNALLFGAWNSTGQGGGLGAKFARSLTSEVVAIGVPTEELVKRTGEITPRTTGRRPGSRIDPLGIMAKVAIYKSAEGWHVDQSQAGKGAKEVKPSEVNHGNIRPSVQPLGITCDHLEHTFVLSFAGLRRLRFGGPAQRDAAGRTYLAALGLLALCEQDARGYALRSRCDLVCDGASPLEVVHPDGSVSPVALNRATARELYASALDAARAAGFAMAAEPLRLTPQDKLIEIVRRSQDLALSGAGEGVDDDGAGT